MDKTLESLIQDARMALLFDSPSPGVVDALSGTLAALVEALSSHPADYVRGVCEQCGNPFSEHYCAPIPSCIHLPAARGDREALIAVFERTPADEPGPEDEHESAPGAYHRMWEERMAEAVLEAGFSRRSGAVAPTTDDVREALADVIERVCLQDIGEQADAILARFEVRPRGTVTETPKHMNGAGAVGSGVQRCETATDRLGVAAIEDTDSPSSPPRPTTHPNGSTR